MPDSILQADLPVASDDQLDQMMDKAEEQGVPFDFKGYRSLSTGLSYMDQINRVPRPARGKLGLFAEAVTPCRVPPESPDQVRGYSFLVIPELGKPHPHELVFWRPLARRRRRLGIAWFLTAIRALGNTRKASTLPASPPIATVIELRLVVQELVRKAVVDADAGLTVTPEEIIDSIKDQAIRRGVRVEERLPPPPPSPQQAIVLGR